LTISPLLQGIDSTYTSDGFVTSTFLQGNANRYYRSNDEGLYVQDKFQFRSNLSLSRVCALTATAALPRRAAVSTISIRLFNDYDRRPTRSYQTALSLPEITHCFRPRV